MCHIIITDEIILGNQISGRGTGPDKPQAPVRGCYVNNLRSFCSPGNNYRRLSIKRAVGAWIESQTILVLSPTFNSQHVQVFGAFQVYE